MFLTWQTGRLMRNPPKIVMRFSSSAIFMDQWLVTFQMFNNIFLFWPHQYHLNFLSVFYVLLGTLYIGPECLIVNWNDWCSINYYSLIYIRVDNFFCPFFMSINLIMKIIHFFGTIDLNFFWSQISNSGSGFDKILQFRN